MMGETHSFASSEIWQKRRKMAEKDVVEKTLEAYNDVFADIVNVLLFQGREVIKENELEDESARSHYKAEGKLHEQERDVAKFWKNGSIRIALYGLENQTDIDADMPLRVIGYDGAAYRAQLLGGEKQRYPVVTLILYFGERRWRSPLSLWDCMDIPEELRPFINDYRIHVFEIGRLTEQQVACFQSDFRIVADYFVQKYKNKNYQPGRQVIRHVHEVMELLGVLAKDYRFEEIVESLEGGQKVTMCDVVDKFVEQGTETAVLTSIINLMGTTGWTVEQAMDALKVEPDKKERYRKLVAERQEVL